MTSPRLFALSALVLMLPPMSVLAEEGPGSSPPRSVTSTAQPSDGAKARPASAPQPSAMATGGHAARSHTTPKTPPADHTAESSSADPDDQPVSRVGPTATKLTIQTKSSPP